MKKVTGFIVVIIMFFSSCSNRQFDKADEIIFQSIKDRIFPGAVLLVGNSKDIIYEKAYGHFTYAQDSKPVEINSIFDMASLSKVFGTGMCVMKCIDSGLVDPEAFVVDYLPEFNNHGKDVIKVKHLLMHNSGLPAYARAQKTAEETLDLIMNIEMQRDLGEYKYSCLNFITLMRVVEAATGKKMWQFYEEVYSKPMDLERTFYSPSDEMKTYCLPTIGDSTGTQILRQGVVHDPLALSLEGYSGNAGLFSTAEDLAKFCQLMLNRGELNGKRYVSEDTIEPFMSLQSGTRAYAWGMNNYKSSAGELMSKTAIGHTGYTGTCAWIDHEKDVFIVFLTNRVYPQDKKAVTPVRRAVNDAVMKTLIGN